MSEFSRETLLNIIETDHVQCGEASALARIALAAMDSEPVVQPVMFIDGDISSDDADKLAKIIREFNEEDERPLAKMARIIRENPHPTNECDMPKAQPAPVVPTFDEWLEIRGSKPLGWVKDAMRESYDACRAAMLQAVPLTNEGDIALHNYRTALEGIGHIRRTLEETFGGLHGTHVEPDVLMDCKTICDAIYAAYSGNSPAIPDGYVMVPKGPTEEMNKAGWAAMNEHDSINPTYRAMLAAATQLPGSEPAAVPGRWIPVSERMPDPKSELRVCVYTPTEPKDIRYRFISADLFKAVCSDATHWHYMTEPAAPKEVG